MQSLDLPERPWIVGHRGVRETVPENTVESVREAVTQRADMVEIDLQLTRDRQLVVFHDRTIALDDGQVAPLGRLTLSEIRRCRPLWRSGGLSRPYTVPALAEILAAVPANLPLNLELKQYADSEEPAALVEALAAGIDGRGQILVSSFDAALLIEARKRLPDLPLAPLGGRDARWDDLAALARRLDGFSIHIHHQLAQTLADRGRLSEPGARERPIVVYTVNETEQAARLLEAGVAGLFTDRPGALRAGLEARAGRPPA